MAEISDVERAALADPVVRAAVAAAKAGDGELRRRRRLRHAGCGGNVTSATGIIFRCAVCGIVPAKDVR